MRELYISFGPKWALNKWFWTLSMKFEVWERWMSITGGAGTAFPCVQWHFNHITLSSLPNFLLTLLSPSLLFLPLLCQTQARESRDTVC